MRPSSIEGRFFVFQRKNCRLSLRGVPVDTYPCMEHRNDHLQPASENALRGSEDNRAIGAEDAELAREFQEFAQWLLDVYLWRLQQERKTRGDHEIDNHPPAPTI